MITISEHKNRCCRKAVISNFRNLGYDQKTEIVLNRTLDRFKMGGLTVLIGPNNAGKSNVLDAISCSKFNNFSENDIPEYIANEEHVPHCEIIATDDEEEYITNIDWKQAIVDNIVYGELSREQFEMFQKEFINRVKTFHPELSNPEYYKDTEIYATYEMIKTLGNNRIRGYSDYSYDSYDGIIHDIQSNIQKLEQNPEERKRFIENYVENYGEFYDIHGYSLYPRIIAYKERMIKQSDLKSPYKPFNEHMIKILSACNGVKKVANAYDKYQKTGNVAFLTKVEQYLNDEIQDISDRFNTLYYAEDVQYSFAFRLMDNTINLQIFLGDQPLNLDNQSTGFRWFMNFFFNLICDTEINSGDIVLIDEPAANLHVAGQIELRDFIRNYGKTSGIMFIISTHSPFFIDCDYLDDVRIIQRKEDGTSVIYDKFSTISPEDPDQMDPILRNLTIGRHVVMEPSKKTVFVEGITDYNYLTAAKILFNYNDIVFMPINGIKKDHFTNDDIIKRLRKIDSNPILLVDGDAAGDNMIESAKGKGIEVISLKSIDGRFKTIESLFKKEDLEKFNLTDKGWHSSSVFKQFILENADELSEFTKDNFKKVLENLSA